MIKGTGFGVRLKLGWEPGAAPLAGGGGGPGSKDPSSLALAAQTGSSLDMQNLIASPPDLLKQDVDFNKIHRQFIAL